MINMIRRLLQLSLLTTVVLAHSAALGGETKTLVLVADSGLEAPVLGQRDLRKLYLGFAYASESGELTAVRNVSDALLYEVFLQKILYMSARTYERQLATRAMHAGMKRPPEIDQHEALITYLHASKSGVTFMWEDDARRNPNIKVLQTLWQGVVD